MVRYSIRIKLTDFIGTTEERNILSTISTIAQQTGKKLFLKLWYLDGEISQKDLMKFLEQHEKLLESIGTNIHVGEHETWMQKSWFNVRKVGTTTATEYRHEYFYTNVSGILDALNVFRTMLTKMDGAQTVQSAPNHKKESHTNHSNGYRVTVKRVPHA